ncbi:4'-phosphopantetheinyl transferase family protein [Streptomyces sp. NPDC088812]|uniref:4'-phosphopantetheinyl transferase family protein n=1 Tax=Streptomyces sp. NPDC088812 TaxID=3365905 RepID=UPI003800497D
MVTLTEPASGRRLAWAEIDELCAPADRGRHRPGPHPAHGHEREHRAGRLLVRRLLHEAGLSADAAVATRPEGRPYLPAHPGLCLSVSHSGTMVAAALADHPVGMDLQEPLPPSSALIRRCCAPDDAARLRALPERERAIQFAYIWTAQEACVKATGRGFADAPWNIPVPLGARAGRWRSWAWHHLTHPACPYPLCLAGPASEASSDSSDERTYRQNG